MVQSTQSSPLSLVQAQLQAMQTLPFDVEFEPAGPNRQDLTVRLRAASFRFPRAFESSSVFAKLAVLDSGIVYTITGTLKLRDSGAPRGMKYEYDFVTDMPGHMSLITFRGLNNRCNILHIELCAPKWTLQIQNYFLIKD